MGMRNEYNAQNSVLRGKTFVGKGAVLFKYSDFSGPVRIVTSLETHGNLETLGEHTLDVPGKNPDRFVLFEAFPPSFLRQSKFVQFELELYNMFNSDETATATVEVFSRR
jgi:hypothetical protein